MRDEVKNKLSATLFVKMSYDLPHTPPRYLLPQLSISLNSRQTPPVSLCNLAAPTADSKQD
jgi:hypothetical protein